MEPSEGEEWAKFPAHAHELQLLEATEHAQLAGHDDVCKVLCYLLTELIKQRAEIRALKAALNIGEN